MKSEVGKGEHYHRIRLHEVTTDKTYKEIACKVNACYGNHLRIQHICFFKVSQLESSVSFEEDPYKHTVNADKHPVSAAVIGENYGVAVVNIPYSRKSGSENSQQNDCERK